MTKRGAASRGAGPKGRDVPETGPEGKPGKAAGPASPGRFYGALLRGASPGPRPGQNGAMPRSRLSPGRILHLRARSPFDWDGLLDFLGPRAIPGVERVEGGRYRRTIAPDGLPGILSAEPGDEGIDVMVSGPAAEAAGDFAPRLARLFDLGADPGAILDALGGDPLIGSAIRARPGLRVPGAWDGFELAVRAVLGQQVSVAGATTLAGRLAAAHGEALDPELAAPGLTHLFPTPARLAAADPAGFGLPGARARALSGLARVAAADAALFVPGDLDADLARLDALPGIGPWTAAYVAMRALGHRDVLPPGDLGLLRALGSGTDGGEGALPPAGDLVRRAEAWRPWRSYAALHLWTSLDPGPRRRAALKGG